MTGYNPTPTPQQPYGPDFNQANTSPSNSNAAPQMGQQPGPQQGDYAQTPYPQTSYTGQTPYPPQGPYAQPEQGSGQRNGGYAPYMQTPPQQAYDPRQPYPPQGGYYPPIEQPWNALCIAGFVLSFVFAPAGLVLSIIALVQINRSGERSKGMSIAGIVIGAVGTVASIFMLIGIITAFNNLDNLDSYYDSNGDSSCSPGDYGCDDDQDDEDIGGPYGDTRDIAWNNSSPHGIVWNTVDLRDLQ